MRPRCIMLVGMPASGKSYAAERIKSRFTNKLIYSVDLLSTDAIVDNVANVLGLTYNDVWQDTIKLAQKVFNRRLESAIRSERNIIWDQTNLDLPGRRKKLGLVPDWYRKDVIFVPTPPQDEWQARLSSRNGKDIPPDVLVTMESRLDVPDVKDDLGNVYHDWILYVKDTL